MRGLADGLDPDSAFLNPGQVQGRRSGRSAAPDGDVGIELTRRYYLLRHRRPRRIAGAQGRPAHGRHDPRDRRQADARHVGLRRHAAAARQARHEGHADDHPRQRRRSARGRAGARQGRRTARDEPADRHDGLSPHRLVPQRRGRGTAQAGARISTKSGAKKLIVDVRRTAEGPLENGIAAARVVHQDRHAGDQVGARQDRSRASRWRPRAGDGTIELPATVLVTTGTSGPARTLRRRAERQQARRS